MYREVIYRIYNVFLMKKFYMKKYIKLKHIYNM